MMQTLSRYIDMSPQPYEIQQLVTKFCLGLKKEVAIEVCKACVPEVVDDEDDDLCFQKACIGVFQEWVGRRSEALVKLALFSHVSSEMVDTKRLFAHLKNETKVYDE